MRITSFSNPRVKDAVRLRSRRARDATGLFVVEGYRELRRAIDAGVDLEEVFYCPELFLGTNERALLARADAGATEVAEGPFRKMSYRDRPEGLLAIARKGPTSLERIPVGSESVFLVVESIEKPGNLGTMLRAACACDVSGVIVCDPTTDVFNPNVVRSSLGTLFLLPVGTASTGEVVTWLDEHEICGYVTTPEGRRPYWEPEYAGRVAIIVGSEQYGLSAEWLEGSKETIRIPMPGPMDSLNVALAAGVVLFEVARRRYDARGGHGAC